MMVCTLSIHYKMKIAEKVNEIAQKKERVDKREDYMTWYVLDSLEQLYRVVLDMATK